MTGSDWLFGEDRDTAQESAVGTEARDVPPSAAPEQGRDDDLGVVEERHEARGEGTSVRARFRAWRHARPFWGGLFTMLGGVEIMVIPLMAWRMVLIAPSVVLAAAAGAVIVILGIMIWLNPALSQFYGLLTVLAAIVAFVTSNLGGFFVGSVLSLLGGALAFAWTVLEPHDQPEEAGTTMLETPAESDHAGVAGA